MGRPFTVDDLEFLPDDGSVYELIDGVLIVSPTPGRRHQRALDRTVSLLESVCPPELEVLWPPFVVRPSEDTELRPDVQVAWSADIADEVVLDAPELVVEIVDPCSAINDGHNKKAAYERLGVPHLWLLDPGRPSLVVFTLVAGRYREAGRVRAEEEFETSEPFPVRVVLTELLGRPRE